MDGCPGEWKSLGGGRGRRCLGGDDVGGGDDGEEMCRGGGGFKHTGWGFAAESDEVFAEEEGRHAG